MRLRQTKAWFAMLVFGSTMARKIRQKCCADEQIILPLAANALNQPEEEGRL